MPSTTQKDIETRLKAFEHWCNTQNYNETSRILEIGRNTIIRIAKEDKWDERFAKIHKSVLKKQETAISNRMVENLKHIRFVKRKVLSELLKKKATGASVSDLIKVLEYEDKAIARSQGFDVDTPTINISFRDKLLAKYEAPVDSDRAEETQTNVH